MKGAQQPSCMPDVVQQQLSLKVKTTQGLGFGVALKELRRKDSKHFSLVAIVFQDYD